MMQKKSHFMRVTSLLTAAVLTVSITLLPATAAEEVTAETVIPIDTEHFPDETFRHYVSEYLDTLTWNEEEELSGKDGMLSQSEMEAVTQIDVTGMGIKTLEGIGSFTSLTTLLCDNNALTALDLSQNTALTKLSCSNNQLAELTLSQNAPLESLVCYFNPMPALDIGSPANLTDFHVISNLTEQAGSDGSGGYFVELPAAVDFSRLSVDESGGVEADAANHRILLPSLSDFFYTYAIDESRSMYVAVQPVLPLTDDVFPDPAFRAVLQENDDTDKDGSLAPAELSNITSLVLDSSYGITDLTGIRHLSSLTDLDVSGVSMDLLDLSGLNQLAVLDCRACGLSALNLTGLTSLKDLDCSGNRLTSLELTGLTGLETLRCADNQLTSLQLTGLTSLTDLDGANNQLAALDLADTPADITVHVQDNTRQITVPLNCRFPLSDLPEMDPARIVPDSLTHAVLDGDTLVLDDLTGEAVSYTYILRQTETETVTEDFSLMPAAGKLEISAAVFPDEKFRSVVQTVDTDGDGYLSLDETEAVTEWDLSGRNIRDLTGISLFPSLTVLDVSGNSLRSLDVSALTELQELNCSINNLTSLELGTADVLRELNCAQNNLTQLRLSTLLSLETLDCSSNKLASLELSGLNHLTTLRCSRNALTALQLPAGDARLEQLACNSNQLTVLELSGCRNLTHLNCSSNALTELELSGLSQLEEVLCANNQLTKLDLTNCGCLTYLNCSANQLTELELSGLELLTAVDCLYNQLCCLHLPERSDGAVPAASLAGNVCPVQLDFLGRIRLSQLPGGWDPSRVSGLENGSIVGDFLTVTDPEQNVTYDYNISNSDKKITASFTIQPMAATESTRLAIDAIHFPDEVFRRLIRQYDLDEDGYFYRIELELVDALIANNLGIRDLTGVEYFSALETLECTGNNIAELKLSGLPKLRTINCAINNISVLELSDLPALKQLYCDYNQLTELELSGVPGVSDLSCSGNQLTELHVTGLPALEYLYCEMNDLTELDLHGLSDLQYLDCSGNALTELDLTEQTHLVQLGCRENYLTCLDVSHSVQSVRVSAENNCVEIQVPAISTLDLSTIPGGFVSDDVDPGSWTNAVCENNIITIQDLSQPVTYDYVIDTKRGLVATFTWMPRLSEDAGIAIDSRFPDEAFRSYVQEHLDINGDGFLAVSEIEAVHQIHVPGLDIQDLTGITTFVHLTDLNCDSNKLTNLDLTGLTHLQNLSCRQNCLTSLDVLHLTELRTLRCGANQLTDLDLHLNHLLTTLECAQNQLTRLAVNAQPDLTSLQCSDNQIQTISLTGSSLLELDCHMNAFFELPLENLVSLKSLDCSDNMLTGALDLSRMHDLQTLVADNNGFYSLILAPDALLDDFSMQNCITTITPDLDADDNVIYDLSKLDGLDAARCSEWVNASQQGTMLTIDNPLDSMTYRYDTGHENVSPEFILRADQIPIEAADIVLEQTEYVFHNTFYTPMVTVTVGGRSLQENVDYTVRYVDNHDAGTATVIVKAVEGSSWYGWTSATFEIRKATPVVSPEIEQRVYYEGEKSPELVLGEGSDHGDIAWTSAFRNYLLEAGINVLEWIFTPTDNRNVESVQGTIEILAQSTETSASTTTETTTTTAIVTATAPGSEQRTEKTDSRSTTATTMVSASSVPETTSLTETSSQLESETTVTWETTTSQTTSQESKTSAHAVTTTVTIVVPVGSSSAVSTTTHVSLSTSSKTTTSATTFTRPVGSTYTFTTTTIPTESTQTTSSLVTTSTADVTTESGSQTTGLSTTSEGISSASFVTTTSQTTTTVSSTRRSISITKPPVTTDAFGGTGTTTTTIQREIPTVTGDANFNHEVDSGDAFEVLLYSSNIAIGNSAYMLYPDDMLINYTLLMLCDVDKNHKVDSSDAFWILKYVSYQSLGIDAAWEDVINGTA